MIASRDWPDVFKAGLEKAGGARKLHEDGVIMELTGLMPDHAPNLWRIIHADPNTLGQYMDSEGRAYSVKLLMLDPSMNYVLGPVIREDWLIALGLEVPETMDEFYRVLTAFRDRDPNGNGLADEIPLTGVKFRDPTYSISKFTVWPFGTTPDMYIVDDKVVYGPLTPEFREGMEWAARFYREGLLDPDYLLNDRGKLDAKMAQNRVGVLYHWLADGPLSYMERLPGKIPGFSITGIPYLRKDENSPNYSFTEQYQSTVTQTEAVITTAAEFPEETLEWLDYPFSPEGHMLFNFGIEGESYEMINGYPRYTAKIRDNPKHSLSVAHQLFHMAQNAWPIRQDPRHTEQLLTHPAADACQEAWKTADLSRAFPPGVKFDYKTLDTMNQFDIDIKTYADEFMNKLIIGQASFDEWDEFKERIHKLGIQKVIAMYQNAYDDYLTRLDALISTGGAE
jgi:putative aldouronate transport system substrate-binding protein